jgi:hypothetical protein
MVQAARLRPTFEVRLPLPADESIERIRRQIAESASRVRALSAGNCADFFIDENERRLWSPYLSVQIQDSDSGSLLRGRFSPRPEIWTFVMFVYFLMVFVILFGVSYGYVQWAIGESPWGLVAVPIAMFVIVLLHTVSLVGQRLSADQSEQLRARLEEILEAAFGADGFDVEMES